MAEDETSTYVLLIVTVVAILGLGLAITSFARDESMGSMMGGGGNGMMGNPGATTTTAPGGAEWAVLLASAAFLVIAVALLLRVRSAHAHAPAPASPAFAPVPAQPPAPVREAESPGPQEPSTLATPAPAVAEPTLVKLLNEDERRMYLELRNHGGAMYQRDLVALGIFSKAKVTRVLDKLETKGLVVREAHGMTNRVRLVNLPAR